MGGKPLVGTARTERIIGAAMRVHSALGAGLLESVYETCLAWELRQAGFVVEVQKPLPLVYRGVTMESGFRLDLSVDGRVLVEVKSVQRLEPVHLAQALTYLKLSGYEAALLLNFNAAHLKDGIRRFAPRLGAFLPYSPPPGSFGSWTPPEESDGAPGPPDA